MWMRVCFIFLAMGCGLGVCLDPEILYLTYGPDPTHSISIHWHTDLSDGSSKIFYRETGQKEWKEAEGSQSRIDRYEVAVHTVELDSLQPGATYGFRIGKGKEYRFRTLDPQKKIVFAVGGDAYRYLSRFRAMNAAVARKNPDFVVMGGDIAYTHGIFALFKGKDWEIKRWNTFFVEWKKSMVTADGRLIPIVPVLGNHDLKKKKSFVYGDQKTKPLFFDFFPVGQEIVSYRAVDIGSRCSLFLLDTNHWAPIEGEQTAWLQEALERRKEVSLKIAAYHISAYPAVYPYDGQTPVKIRNHWVPLFEKYHLQVAFEHHNHAYKRTYPIKEEERDEEGVVYMGDGCWGVAPRKTTPRWYLARRASVNHCCLVTLDKGACYVEAFNHKGKQIDLIYLTPKVSLKEELQEALTPSSP